MAAPLGQSIFEAGYVTRSLFHNFKGNSIKCGKITKGFGSFYVKPNRELHNSPFRGTKLLQLRYASRPLLRAAAATAGVVAFGGCFYAVIKWYNIANSVYATGSAIPDYKISRKVKNESDNTGLKLKLFQYQTCPFCCKVRAFLDYHGISYDVIEVNSVWRTQVKWSKYKKVPIIVCEGIGDDGYIQLNDSSVIISVLKSFLYDRATGLERMLSYYPALEEKKRGKVVYEFPNRYFIMHGENEPVGTPDQRKEERKWRDWADSHMVHMLSPNVYRTPKEALQAFHYFNEVGEWEQHFSKFERLTVIYLGASVMYILGKLLKRRYGLKDDVRESLFDACDEWVKAVGKKRAFMGGDQPNLADLAVYGVLNSIEGCDAFQEVLAKTKIKDWYFQTKKAVSEHAGSQFS